MSKLIIVANHPRETPEHNGRMVHSIHLARDLVRAGAEVRFVHCGRGVEWLDQWVNRNDDSHPFLKNYGPVFDEVRHTVEACNMCCKRFNQSEAVLAAGIPVVGEGREHHTLAAEVLDGWQIVSF